MACGSSGARCRWRATSTCCAKGACAEPIGRGTGGQPAGGSGAARVDPTVTQMARVSERAPGLGMAVKPKAYSLRWRAGYRQFSSGFPAERMSTRIGERPIVGPRKRSPAVLAVPATTTRNSGASGEVARMGHRHVKRELSCLPTRQRMTQPHRTRATRRRRRQRPRIAGHIDSWQLCSVSQAS